MPNFIIPDASSRPSVSVSGSRAQVYAPGGLNTLPAITVGGKDGATLTLTVSVKQGKGTLVTSASGSGATVSGGGSKTLTVTGSADAVNTVAEAIDYDTPEDETGEILFDVKVSDGSQEAAICSQNGVKLVPGGEAVPFEDKAPEATVTLSGTNGSTIITVNGDAIGYGVPFNGTVEQTAQDAVVDINSTETTPNFTAEYISGSTIKIIGPTALGDDGNGMAVDILTDGDMSLDGDTALSGGATQGFDPLDFFHDYLEGPLIGLGSAIGGQVISNLLFPNTGQVNLKLPEIYLNDGTDKEKIDIAFLYKGRLPRVPVGYDGENRVAPASWDYATFEEKWTNNPVWCALDYLESKRYGCGNLFRMTDAQRTALYKQCWNAALWCDELVDDGKGGTEPRFSFDCPVAGLSKIETLQAIISVAHGQFIFPGTGPQLVIDMPSAPVLLVNKANAAQGGLTFRGSGIQGLYNVVNVGWQNPAKLYRREFAFAEDRTSVEKYGQRSIDVILPGATNSRQAVAHGKWILETDKADPLVVSYKAGWDHYKARVGDIIRVFDDKIIRSTVNNGGGRVISATQNTVTLDRNVVITGYPMLHVTLTDGSISTHTVTSYNPASKTATVSPAFPTPPEPMSVWLMGEGKLFKMTSINRERQGVYKVTAVYHDPSKYARIDGGSNTGIGNVTPKSWTDGPVVASSNIIASGNAIEATAARLDDTRALATWLVGTTRYGSIIEVVGDKAMVGPASVIQTGGEYWYMASLASLGGGKAILVTNTAGSLGLTMLDVGATQVQQSSHTIIKTGDNHNTSIGVFGGGSMVLVGHSTGTQGSLLLYGVTGSPNGLNQVVIPDSYGVDVQVVGMSSNSALVTYSGNGGLFARRVTVDGTTITLGSPNVIDPAVTYTSRGRLARVTDNTAVLCYRQSGSSAHNGVNVMQVTGGTITSTGYIQNGGGAGHLHPVVANAGRGEVMLLNRSNTDGSISRRVLTINYTDITQSSLGDEVQLYPGQRQVAACRLTNSKMLLLNADGTTISAEVIRR